jgi:hypothetical protein
MKTDGHVLISMNMKLILLVQLFVINNWQLI